MIQTIQMTAKKSSMYRNDRTNENGRRDPIKTEEIEDRKTQDTNNATTVADNVVHRTGRDNITVRQKQLNAETAKEKGQCKKKCRTVKKLQYVERTTSSAEEEN